MCDEYTVPQDKQLYRIYCQFTHCETLKATEKLDPLKTVIVLSNMHSLRSALSADYYDLQ